MTVAASYCLFHRVHLPDRYPIQPRPEMTTRRPSVVATRGDEALLCGCEHDGAHLWPDGDEVERVDDAIEARPELGGAEIEIQDGPLEQPSHTGDVEGELFDGAVEEMPDAGSDDETV